jgi:hypothetical protein
LAQIDAARILASQARRIFNPAHGVGGSHRLGLHDELSSYTFILLLACPFGDNCKLRHIAAVPFNSRLAHLLDACMR